MPGRGAGVYFLQCLLLQCLQLQCLRQGSLAVSSKVLSPRWRIDAQLFALGALWQHSATSPESLWAALFAAGADVYQSKARDAALQRLLYAMLTEFGAVALRARLLVSYRPLAINNRQTPSTRHARRTTLETLHRRGVRARLHVLLPLQADLVLLRDEVRHHEERLLLARLRQQPQRVLRALGVLLRQRDRVI